MTDFVSSWVGETPAYISACGNDRKLRVYDVKKGSIASMIYLKSKLTKLLHVEDLDINLERKRIYDVSQVKKEAETKKLDEESEAKKIKSEDDLWGQLEEAAK